MHRLSLIVALLAIVAVTFVPVFDSVIPHHDDTTMSHASQDDGCGCVCHASVNAVVAGLSHDIHLVVAPAHVPFDHSRPDPLPASLDRPPELFS